MEIDCLLRLKKTTNVCGLSMGAHLYMDANRTSSKTLLGTANACGT